MSANETCLFTERTHLKCQGLSANSSEQTGFVRRDCDLHLWMYPSVFQINLAHSGSDVAEQPAFPTRSPWATIAKENGRICKRKQPVNRKNTSQMPRTGDEGVNETGFCFVIQRQILRTNNTVNRRTDSHSRRISSANNRKQN